MTEDEFWRCTPRKLYALYKLHLDIMNPDGSAEQPIGQASNQGDAIKAVMAW